MSVLCFFDGEVKEEIKYEKNDLCLYDYQIVVDALLRAGKQLNKRSLRFIKSDVIGEAFERATNGRLKYVDDVGYDSIDMLTGLKYEIKSEAKMFNSNGTFRPDVTLCNTYNTKNVSFTKTFDFLLCVDTFLPQFAVAELDWQTCYDNHFKIEGQFRMKKTTPIKRWISKDKTRIRDITPVDLDLKKFLEPLFHG
jgi:hypothetical protein